jgi:uncharacterized membrane protein
VALLAQLVDIPVGLLAILAVVAVVEVTLDVAALVHLYRTPSTQVVGRNKWIWVAVIVLVNLVGAILYLAVGHRAAPAAEAPVARQPDRVGDLVDSLYGPSDRQPAP